MIFKKHTHNSLGTPAMPKKLLPIGLLVVFQCLALQATYAQDCDAGFSVVISCNEVTFTPDVIDSEYVYTWDFGDGTTSSETSPTHTYISIGNNTAPFTATLTVSSSTCNENMSDMNITVAQVPEVNIGNADPDEGFTNCEAAFDPVIDFCVDNLSTTNNSFYEINFGDPGSPDNEYSGANLPDGTVCHEYTTVGLYIIEVTVTGVNGCTNTNTFEFFNGSLPAGQYDIQDNTFGCVPATFEFFLDPGSDIEGTQYIFTTNDGSSPQVFNFPPPASFTHTYQSTSCDTFAVVDGITFPGSYQATITVVNPCGERPSSGGQIYVDEPPTPDFRIEPDSIQCQNEVFSFINTSDPGISYSISSNSCTDELDVSWEIMPGTGWNNLSGTLDDIDSLAVQFTEAGEYDITLLIEHSSSAFCGPREITKTICVRPIPESSFNLDTDNGCAAETTINADNTSNTLNSCGEPADYTWRVEFVESECGNAPEYEFVDNTDSTDIDASIRFDAAGIYNIYLFVENECGRDSSFQQVTISGEPILNIADIPDSCFYGAVEVFPVLEAAAGCYATPSYTWDFGDGDPDSGTGEMPGGVVFDQAGEYTITVTSSNSCGDNSATETFELIAPPNAPDISNNSPVCVGEDIIFTNNTNNPNLSYEWIGPDNFFSTSPDFIIEDADTDNDGIYTLTVTDLTTGCFRVIEYDVVVTTNAPLTITPAEICIGQSATLTASGASDFLWMPDEYISSTMGSTVTISPPDTGTYIYYVEGQDNIQCNGFDSVTVVVHPLPTVNVDDPGTLCVNTNYTLLGSPNAPGNGFWTGPFVNLDTIPDDCEVINIDPVFDYGIPNEFIDSVLWKVTNSAGELVYTSMDLDPGIINIMGDDDYTIMVTAYNRCDSSVAMDNFSILGRAKPAIFYRHKLCVRRWNDHGDGQFWWRWIAL
jgi:PKD repeat protein